MDSAFSLIQQINNNASIFVRVRVYMKKARETLVHLRKFVLKLSRAPPFDKTQFYSFY